MLANRSMAPNTVIPVLAYADVDVAVSWLCDTFGFQERWRLGTHRAQLWAGDAVVVVRDGGSGVALGDGARGGRAAPL
jgi:uncharacterized glyoxalase superfamily protein PhnB